MLGIFLTFENFLLNDFWPTPLPHQKVNWTVIGQDVCNLVWSCQRVWPTCQGTLWMVTIVMSLLIYPKLQCKKLFSFITFGHVLSDISAPKHIFFKQSISVLLVFVGKKGESYLAGQSCQIISFLAWQFRQTIFLRSS